jgi:hypothetical protein
MILLAYARCSHKPQLTLTMEVQVAAYVPDGMDVALSSLNLTVDMLAKSSAPTAPKSLPQVSKHTHVRCNNNCLTSQRLPSASLIGREYRCDIDVCLRCARMCEVLNCMEHVTLSICYA